MNMEQEHTSPEDLQHEAEHTPPPHKRGSVLLYLAILFGAAFLLLLMSYFMQQRANREAIDNYQKNSNLRSQLDAADEELRAVEELAEQAQQELQALTRLNQIRTLYNQYRNREAREILAQNPDLEEQLQTISEAMTEEERAIYDPLESYRTLAGWLKND